MLCWTVKWGTNAVGHQKFGEGTMMRILWAALWVLLLLLPSAVWAQSTTEFVNSDGSFRLEVPEDWRVEENRNGGISVNADAASLVVLLPTTLEADGLLTARNNTTGEVLDAFLPLMEFEFDEPEDLASSSRLDGVRADFSRASLRDADLESAFVVALDVDDEIIVVIAFSRQLEMDELEDAVFDIARTFEFGDFEPTNPPLVQTRIETDLPDLTQAAGGGDSERTYRKAIAELEDLDLIPADGELLLNEELLSSGFQEGLTLYEDDPFEGAEFVMAALISFRPVSDEDVLCGLLSRVTVDRRGREEASLFVGFDRDSQVVAFESERGNDERHETIIESGIDIYSPNHLLVVVRDETLTAFLNGIPIIDGWELEQPLADETLFGTYMDPSCVMTGQWVWTLPG